MKVLAAHQTFAKKILLVSTANPHQLSHQLICTGAQNSASLSLKQPLLQLPVLTVQKVHQTHTSSGSVGLKCSGAQKCACICQLCMLMEQLQLPVLKHQQTTHLPMLSMPDKKNFRVKWSE